MWATQGDYFISVHSNAATDGTATNYPLLLYKGSDATAANAGSKEMCATLWPYLFEMMDSELDPYSNYSKTKIKWYISSGSRKQKSIFLIEDINSYQLAVLTI